ncbi:MAG: ribosome biogenesis GTP-binding protein YihA/YsxC [Clostridiales bacterium]|jgi:GTP-binding protein|nr:ribosome biogenesis GTP-binding protein YihA/YsxC [Clostridiales bacterium]
MIVNKVSLEAVCARPDQYPASPLPQFAFVGRSNVGKSSLINTLIGRKALARVSQNPGKTRTINFYNVDEKLFFVDLPGYGYAKALRKESEKWGRLAEDYLKNSAQLRRIIFLVDIRHDPQPSDLQMCEWLKYYNRPMLIAATKSDKIKNAARAKRIAALRSGFGADDSVPFAAFSGETREGFDSVWEIILRDITDLN